ncbi:MAG: zinc-binding dehydrogenase [Mobiluncus porci]|uniref:zinc-binding dehydrogenase n=1 Tax=Mobiluncus porci TaxID=2652278 RepID=UPI0023F20AB3|nr:zinc-binding dehydrogenase [Mobiluncus porci]MDD7540726.1 zinc-binding dehydrogenase [Mobiluncus porci]MDY5748288.1 zinc-binding dehydrogenase [Mobiluncus porci]
MWAIKGIDGQPRVVEVERPKPGPGEVLIEVRAAGVNRADLLQVAGHYPSPPGAPDTLGLETAGVVVEVGEGVGSLATGGSQIPGADVLGVGLLRVEWLGRPVVALLEGGGQAEFAVARADCCLPLPVSGRLDGFIAGAALIEASVTAWHNLVNLEPRVLWADAGKAGFVPSAEPYGESWGYPKGFNVLIQGGSGGVGTVAVQLAKALGARVAASAGDGERRAKLSLLGADATADYHDPKSFESAKQELTDGCGFDLILDVSGAGGLATNLDLLAQGGRLAIIGLQKGTRAEINLGILLSKSASIQGSTIRALGSAEKADLVKDVGEYVWPLVEAEKIRPVVAETYSFAKVAGVHEALAAKTGRPFGKIVLVVD